ncbi:MAG TPA: PQQ-like beta-propeller repeat protein [Verrucomicrobiota bacterium]|nr:PQQ-like beta-propeller repeat protein [Verrucomicrobiota bacterium]
MQWLVWFVVPLVAPEATMFAMLGGVAGGLAVVVWWLFFSRASWPDRLGAIVLMVIALIVTSRFVHPSIANGMMGMLLPIFAIPVLSLALVVGAAAGRRLSTGLRRASMIGAILLACGVFMLLRTGGITGDGRSDFRWRWSETAEERLLAQAAIEPKRAPLVPTPAPAVVPPESPLLNQAGEQSAPPVAAKASQPNDWSGFRGPDRNGAVRSVRIDPDWSQSAPVELWRHPIGPGWSSFAVNGNFFFTQEQRGDDEVVACYELTTRAPAWIHRDPVRFWESNAGAGPRATPTFSNGRIYSFGGTGILNALDARDGSVVWTRNAASDTHKKIPEWGFASSPLVVGDQVVVATAGILAAYDLDTGKLRWVGPPGGWGYGSPQVSTIAGVVQILLLNGAGAISVAPTDGKLLWQHDWKGDGIVQPAVIDDHDVLIGSGSGLGGNVGLRRVAIEHGPGGWSVEERWTSRGLKPYFSDFVVSQGHAFGFDGGLLSCVDLSDGQRKWKGGRYGHGQLILLADQDALLVLSEQGELALVAADSVQFKELARFPAIEGKTWNHPVLVGDVLLVRNSEEMAAFRLLPAKR